MYNLAWGYYVIATVHQDHHDPDPGGHPGPRFRTCFPGSWHGGTDDAEAKLERAAVAFSSLNTPIRFVGQSHSFNLHNRDERGRRGRRLYASDGLATRICARFSDESVTPCDGEF